MLHSSSTRCAVLVSVASCSRLTHPVPHLQLQRRQDRDEVRVPAALADAVHRALHEAGALTHGRDRVRDTALGVVVGVDADHLGAEALDHRARGVSDLVRQARAVRVAQSDVLGTGLERRVEAQERVLGVVAVAVEEVLGVVDDALALRAQDRRPSRRSAARFSCGSVLMTFSTCSFQVLPTRVQTGAKDSPRSVSAGSSAAAHVAAAGHAEGADRRVVEALALEQLEQLRLLRVGARKAGLDEVDAEVVERVRDAQLLAGGEGHALALHAVAESGVV